METPDGLPWDPSWMIPYPIRPDGLNTFEAAWGQLVEDFTTRIPRAIGQIFNSIF